jgi:hypothetical protein
MKRARLLKLNYFAAVTDSVYRIKLAKDEVREQNICLRFQHEKDHTESII